MDETDSQQHNQGHDWQKADVRILGQIMVAQNVIFALPDTIRIAEFYAQTLISIPGISACRVCLEDVTIQKGEIEAEFCAECQALRIKPARQQEIFSFTPGFRCPLADHGELRITAITTLQHHFGFFIFQSDDLATFNVYKPFIENLASYIATSLENRLQRNLLQNAHDELERKVKERTQDLLTSNKQLQDEIETRKQAEHAFRESEERYRSLVEQASDGIFLADSQGNYVDVNPSGCNLLGYTLDEILKMNMRDLVGAGSQGQAPLRFDELRSGNSIISERTLVTKSGALLLVEISGTALDNGNLLGIVRDITERKKAEAQLIASEQLFRALVENSPDFIARYDLEFRRIYVNPAIQQLFGIPAERVLGLTPTSHSPVYAPQIYIDYLRRVIETASESAVEMPFRTAKGEMHWGHMRFAPEFDPEGRVASVLAIGRDIHEIKENERRFRMLAENFPDFIMRFDRRSRFTYTNPAVEKTFGIPTEVIVGKTWHELPLLGQSEQNDALLALIQRTFDEGIANESEAHWDTEMGERTFEIRHVPEKDAAENVVSVLSIARDITERKHHELEREAIIVVSNALRKATTREEILAIILDQLVALFAADGAMLALPTNPSSGDIVIEMGRGNVGKRFTGLRIPPGQGINSWVIANKQPYLNNRVGADARFYRPDLLADAQCVAAVPLIAKEQAIGVLWIARRTGLLEQDLRLFNAIGNIAANALYRVTLHEQTEIQLRHLVALHQIDIAITTNFDLSITLSVIINGVKNELNVDAASIMLLTPLTQTFEYAAGVGFRTRDIEKLQVKLGVGNAGQAALEYRTVSCPDLSQSPAAPDFSILITSEGFVSHFVAPLVVKGQVKGVLEVFQRKLFEPEQEWLAYFETLATQTAIAIDNAFLFENLQRSNAELRLAYDATIEGWSRALDLRDKETEGHTLRVTQMALQLADYMGMNDSEKLQLRRGALLHDIGKMGVPDGILLKPGPLTNDEWEIMRRHPAYAYEMLNSINYLKPALDVPYCHHEKWDGSGYPRGLQGEAIPLIARVFAIVDVFDALIVDRPYRSAWPREKVLAYIQEQSGKHFDPDVVAAFYKLSGDKIG